MAVPAGEMESDSALVGAVQAGDLEAYSELFRRHYPAVLRACARRLACPLEAEEIAQGAFVRALERIHQCRGDRQFGGWVQIIARHMCVDALRARSRVVPTERPVPESHADGNEPHDSLLDRERTMQVRRALDSLPPRQRQAVEARAEGTGPSEIADDLGLTVGAVDSLILRGRRRLALAYHRVAGEGGATATATSATAAASLLAAFSLGSTRLLGGVAAAAEAGRDLVRPLAGAVTGAAMTVAVALGGGGGAPTTTAAAPTPASRPPAAVAGVPASETTPPPAGTTSGAAPLSPPAVSPTPVGADAAGPPPAAAVTTAAPAAAAAAVPTTTVAPAPPPPAGAVAAPVVEPVTEVVETATPVVNDVVGAVGATANDAVSALSSLLPD